MEKNKNQIDIKREEAKESADEIIKDKIIAPQSGRQEQFASSPADIVIYGGSAGGGKTWALLFEFLRNKEVKNFNSVIFRRETPQIRNPGSLWDASVQLYSGIEDYTPRQSKLEARFTHSYIKFSHLEYEDDKYNWDGSEICYIGFDQLEQFSETQFWYLFSRNRSTCGIEPYVRASCNPNPDSWLKELILWYLDKDGEYADLKKAGIIRYFIRLDNKVIWGKSREELMNRYPDELPKSFTFIPSTVQDNKILLEKDPSYLSNLKALNKVERERLEKGNWKIRLSAGLLFKREWFEIVNNVPSDIIEVCRYWDRASTIPSKKNPDPDYTCGLKLSKDSKGYFYIEHLSRFRESSYKMRKNIINIAGGDGPGCEIGLEQEPGASGKTEAEDMIRLLSGYVARSYSPRTDKVTRALPVSAQAEGRSIKIVRGKWNEVLLTELENFDGSGKGHDDIVDVLSGAFDVLQKTNRLVMPKDIKIDSGAGNTSGISQIRNNVQKRFMKAKEKR